VVCRNGPGDLDNVTDQCQDIATYKIASIDHSTKQLKLEQIGTPIGEQDALWNPEPGSDAFLSGNRCGATFIDTSFTNFLRERLGEEDWAKLNDSGDQDDALGGHNILKPHVRLLLDRFQPIKHQFDGKGSKLGWPLQLPRGIGATNDEGKGINNGVLKITP